MASVLSHAAAPFLTGEASIGEGGLQPRRLDVAPDLLAHLFGELLEGHAEQTGSGLAHDASTARDLGAVEVETEQDLLADGQRELGLEPHAAGAEIRGLCGGIA